LESQVTGLQNKDELINSTKEAKKSQKQNKNGLAERSGFDLMGADGLRAIACLSVIIHHIMQRLCTPAQPQWAQETQSFFLLGNAGVSVFFVLSGFLLSYPFWKRYLNDEKFPSMKQYALRRASRIIPGYYASLTISAVILPLVLNMPMESMLRRIISGYTFTSGTSYVTFFPSDINGPLWSIGFEVICYVLMPVFMIGLFGLFGKKRSFIKGFIYWIGAFVLITAANQLVHVLLTPDNVKKGWEYGIVGGAKYWMPNYNPIGFFGHFTMGIFAAGVACFLYKKASSIEKWKKKGLFDLVGVAALLGTIVFLWFARHKPEFSLSIQNQPYFFPILALLMAAILATAPHSLWFGKLLDNRFFRFTAKISFGLYIWHFLVIFAITRLWMPKYEVMQMENWKDWALASVVLLVTSYIIAALSYRFIEKPVLDWAHKKKFK
jgi:peptidoglycan/LPS O-acetylase OafA/YrhL